MAARIMVVDDEPLVCRLLSYQLGGAGYDVITFQNGLEALSRLETLQPDLILLDVMMPEISGWELCRQIRNASSVPVIMLTAKQSDNDVVTGLNSGADDYIGKPFSLPQLLARVEAVLRRVRPVTPRRRSTIPNVPAVPLPAAAAPVPLPGDSPAPAAAIVQAVPPVSRPPALLRLGPMLAAARKARGLSLHDVERACSLRWEYLQALEREHFDYVPRSELRHVLRAYCAFLDVDLRPFARPRPTPRRRPFITTFALSAMVVFAVMVVVIGIYVF